MKDYGAYGFGLQPLGLDLQHRAIEAARAHPNYEAASAYPYCEPIVFILEEERLLAMKSRFPKALARLDRAVVVCFMTGTSAPQGLTGGRKSYDFILHPESMEILHASIGEWRS